MERTKLMPTKYLNSIEGSDAIFGLCRCEMTCFNRVFNTVESAVSTLISKCKEMMETENDTKRATFEVIQGATTIHKAYMRPDHTIVYLIKDGVMVSNRRDKQSKSINPSTIEETKPSVIETKISNNMNNSITITESELAFLTLDKQTVHEMAVACQNAVINHRKSKTLCQKVLEISNRAVTISTTKNWDSNKGTGTYEVDDDHVLFKSWDLFKKCHGHRNAGKKRIDKVADTIEDVWTIGQTFLANSSPEKEIGVTPIAKSTNNVDDNHTSDAVTQTPEKKSEKTAPEFIKGLVDSILVFATAKSITLSFLKEKGFNIESEVSSKTSNLLSCSLTSKNITLKSKLGNRDIPIESRTVEEIKSTLSSELVAILLVLSAMNPEKVSLMFDLKSVAELYQPLVNKIAA